MLEPLESRLPLAGDLIIGNAGGTEGTIANDWTEIHFPISYSGDAVPAFTVNWEVTLSGTANAADFPEQFMSGTVAFQGLDQPGGETKDAIIRIWADRMVELDETFQVHLTGVSNQSITISDAYGDGTITDDDLAEIQVHIKGTAYSEVYSINYAEGNSGPTRYTWYVNFYLTNPVDVAVSFDYRFADGDPTTPPSPPPATQGTDYTVSSSSGTVTFQALDEGYPDGFTEITVRYVGDDVVELDEVFTLLLENFNNQGRAVSLVDNSVPFTIENDEFATVFIMADTYPLALEKLEKDPGEPAPTFKFRVYVDKAVDTPFTVDVATRGGTATAGEDYIAEVEGINFAGNADEHHYFEVTGKVDTKLELNEDFEAVIQDNIQASGRDVRVAYIPSASATILNDDHWAKVSISGGSVTEGDSGTKQLAFTLSLDNAVDHDVVVVVSIWGGSAIWTPGSEQDFVLPQNGQVTVTIPAGQTTASFNITVLGDTRDEDNETIVASIFSIDSGDFNVVEHETQNEATGTIVDDDP